MRSRKETNDAGLSQKSKIQTSSSASRLIPKKIWKSRSKSSLRSNSIIPQWTPQGHCRWLSSNGRWYNLCDTSLMDLCEMEKAALKQISITKLQAYKLGCKIESPKEHSSGDKKRRPYMLKKKALTTGMFDRKEKRNQEIPSGLVFGTTLGKCLENDRTSRIKSSIEGGPKPAFRSRSTTHASLLSKTLKSATSCHSLSDFTRQDDDIKRFNLNFGSSESNESLDFVKRNQLFGKSDSIPDLNSTLPEWNKGPSVPVVVQTCFNHLETHGLNTVGIFRVSGSKKRVRQLRDDFDTGKEIKLTEDHQPHDVAQLLKEYFRDLKEPLLTKELYATFIATKKLRNVIEQREALQHLLCLLPTANRDTLWALLNFLNNVVAHSEDSKDELGEKLAGNKMDSYNLATLFGPNILRSHKSGSDKEYKVESTMRAEERSDVIRVTQTLIDHQLALFTLNADLMDLVYLHIQHKDPNSLNSLLCYKCNLNDHEAENDSFSGLKMRSRKNSESIETIAKDDSSEINSPLGSASSFNEIIFMDAEEIKNGYQTSRGHSASNLPVLSSQRSKALDVNSINSQTDLRRRSSEDVNSTRGDNQTGGLLLGDKSQALSVPDVAYRRLSSPEISKADLSEIKPMSKANRFSTSSSSIGSQGSPTSLGSEKLTMKSSSEEATKPILKSPTEHFKVFVTDDNSGTERLAGEFQTVKFKTTLVESTSINRAQRPQICHLLTMPQPAITRLPKFTLSQSTIAEDTSMSNSNDSLETEDKVSKAKPATDDIAVIKNSTSDQTSPTTKPTSKLQGILKTLKSSSIDKGKADHQTSKSTADQMKSTESTSKRRTRPKTEGNSSPTRTRKDFLRRRRVRDRISPKLDDRQTREDKQPKTCNAEKESRCDSEKTVNIVQKPDQWKRWEIISSEYTETYV